MHPKFKQLIIIVVVLAVLFFVGAAAADTAALSVKINGESYVVNGELYTFIAEVTPADSNVTLSWSSENPAVASVNTDGEVIGNSAGRTIITVTASTADGVSVSDAIDVEVYDFVSDILEYAEESIELIDFDEPMPVFAAAPANGLRSSEPSDSVTRIPSKFDLRNVNGKNYVSGVRNQGGFGLCWMFATVSSIESNLILNGYADTSIDLSELHGYYYTSHLSDVTITNPQLSLKGLWGDPGVSGRTLSSGGWDTEAYSTFLAGIGLVDENVVPYCTGSSSMKLDPSYATEKNVYEVVEYIKISIKDPESVKKLIMTYGTVWIDLALNTKTINGYTTSNNPNSGGNHAISIVGWDDNFAKENFSPQPANNGAWLIKNSWGSTWGNMGGYVWVSYEDKSIYSPLAVASAVPADSVVSRN